MCVYNLYIHIHIYTNIYIYIYTVTLRNMVFDNAPKLLKPFDALIIKKFVSPLLTTPHINIIVMFLSCFVIKTS